MTYKPPTTQELRDLLARLNLSRSQAGKLADVTGDKIGKWCAGKGQMPFSVLHTIINKSLAIDVSQGNWREEI